ncbi:unnamed protein product [Moneuplotes crassus]|uniref:Uncharacterized protein n=1 Tax=Euplotes crassus TaxID=5936 RepID=A0AAD2D2L8_EUPCR|nr:unnamed protein product [Moneuplotes crassus]
MFHLKQAFKRFSGPSTKKGSSLLKYSLRNTFGMSNYLQYFNSLQDFPYVFNNKKTVIPPIKELDVHEFHTLQQLNDMLDEPQHCFREGFSLAYTTLLKMIRDHDLTGIGQVCNTDLKQDLHEEMSEAVFKDIGFKIENENSSLLSAIDIDIIDFNFHISGGMGRGTNSEMNSRCHVYISEDFDMGSQVSIDLEVMVKYITNYKLNAFINKDPEICLIPDSEARDKEIHYVTYETNVSKLELNFWNFLAIRRYANLKYLDDAEWRITDIDGRFGGYRK